MRLQVASIFASVKKDVIEAEYEVLKGALPHGYTAFEPSLLTELIKIFNRDALKQATGDVFGRIYEYFLNKFAQFGAQEGGEFFTPPSLVRMIVNIIEPSHGKVLDPACGSAGTRTGGGTSIGNVGSNIVTMHSYSRSANAHGILKGDKDTIISIYLDIQAGMRPTGHGEGEDNNGLRYQVQF